MANIIRSIGDEFFVFAVVIESNLSHLGLVMYAPNDCFKIRTSTGFKNRTSLAHEALKNYKSEDVLILKLKIVKENKIDILEHKIFKVEKYA